MLRALHGLMQGMVGEDISCSDPVLRSRCVADAYVPRQYVFGDRHPQQWLVQDRQLDACSTLELQGQTRNFNEALSPALPRLQTTSPSPHSTQLPL
jgi:hypothetical protein